MSAPPWRHIQQARTPLQTCPPQLTHLRLVCSGNSTRSQDGSDCVQLCRRKLPLMSRRTWHVGPPPPPPNVEHFDGDRQAPQPRLCVCVPRSASELLAPCSNLQLCCRVLRAREQVQSAKSSVSVRARSGAVESTSHLTVRFSGAPCRALKLPQLIKTCSTFDLKAITLHNVIFIKQIH